MMPDTAEQFQTTPLASVGAKRVYISKTDVLQQALESLSLNMHESKACAVGNNQIIGSVCIDAPAHDRYSVLHEKTIYGDYNLTEEDALESARLDALLCLQNKGFIFVDDINVSELAKGEAELADCRWKLLAASNWATMF